MRDDEEIPEGSVSKKVAIEHSDGSQQLVSVPSCHTQEEGIEIGFALALAATTNATSCGTIHGDRVAVCDDVEILSEQITMA